jgi:tetratricopeptide (TPR) repeat protein/predicted Ser/Thr protein kinase
METLPAAIGRYVVRAFIARGGMGTVYLAWDPHLEREVAIKLLREADNEDLRLRFTREARSAANLRHRNIVTIFDVGEHEQRPFIAMEYVQGQTLSQLIASDAPMSTVRKLQLIEDLCEGLYYAHSRGVVHRDIKPANLMVDGDNVLKILDFGIARAMADAGMTQAGFLVGTLNYMSPEQVAGKALDGRSDMFAVGAVLYELLERKQAFPGNLESGLLNKILYQEPFNFENVYAGIDPAISAIIRRSLEKDPAKRFIDLRMMAAEVASVRHRFDTAARAAADTDTTVVGVDVAPTLMRPARREPDREELTRRRVMHIEDRLAAARRALEACDYDAVVGSCEEALLIDPDEPRVGELLRRAKEGRDQAQADEWVREAQSRLRGGDLTSASNFVREALALVPGSAAAIDLARVIGEARVERDRRRQRAEATAAALDRARVALDRRDFGDAIAGCEEALVSDPGNADALDIRRRAEVGISEREREALDAKARATADEARRMFDDGRHADALALLEEFSPAHKIVSQRWMELSTEAGRLAQEPEPHAEDDAVDRDDRRQFKPDVTRVLPVSPAPADRATRSEEEAKDIGPHIQSSQATMVAGAPQAVEKPAVNLPPAQHRPSPSLRRYYGIGLIAAVAIGVITVTLLLRRGDRPDQVNRGAPEATSAAARPPVTPVPENSPSPGPPPASANELEPQLAKLRQTIQSYLNTSNYRDALSPTMLGLQLRPDDTDFVAAARQIATMAQRDAVRARNAVRPNSAKASAIYADANRSMDQGQRLARSGQTEDSIRAYWRAQDLFKQAGGESPAAPADRDEGQVATAPSVGIPAPQSTPVTPTPPSVTEPPRAALSATPVPPSTPPPVSASAPTPPPAPAPAPAPVAPPAPAAPAAQSPLNEEPAIRATLEAYAQAYRSLNADAVARVFPSVNLPALRRAFQETRQQDVQIENAQVRVQGMRATVMCRIRQVFTPRAGQTREATLAAEFVLEKSNGAWLIVSRR